MTSRPRSVTVEEGRRAAQASPVDRWLVGDLALEAVPPFDQGRDARSAAQRRLADYADEIGLPLGLVKDCWYTSKAWPKGSRIPGISHSKHSTYRARQRRTDLLLNEQLDDGLSVTMRERVGKAEALLADKDLRGHLLDRSTSRSRAVREAARALESEELLKARQEQRIAEQDAKARLAAPHLLARHEERYIRAGTALTRMVSELLDLEQVLIDQTPPTYVHRMVEGLTRVQQAATQALARLRPDDRSPQPGDVIDMPVDD